MSEQTCSACGTRVAPYDGVLLSAKKGARFLCSRCYNETVAEYLGLDYEHVAFDPVILEDRDGIPHTFQFPTRVFSDRLSLEALETGQDEGYEFSVIPMRSRICSLPSGGCSSASGGSWGASTSSRRETATRSPTQAWSAGRSRAIPMH